MQTTVLVLEIFEKKKISVNAPLLLNKVEMSGTHV